MDKYFISFWHVFYEREKFSLVRRGRWIFEKFWHSCSHLYAVLALLRSFVQNGMGSYRMWHKDRCMSERLQLDSDLMLEEPVTGKAHQEHHTVRCGHACRHPHVGRPTKKVTTRRCFRKNQYVCTCHSGPYTHTLAADDKSDNLLLQICFGSKQ